MRTQLFALANRSDGAGTYLFGGQGATQKPFVDAPGGVRFVATGGQTLTESATGLPLTTDGNSAWLTARTGNGVFVTSAAPACSTPPSTPAASPTRALSPAPTTRSSSASAAASRPTPC